MKPSLIRIVEIWTFAVIGMDADSFWRWVTVATFTLKMSQYHHHTKYTYVTRYRSHYIYVRFFSVSFSQNPLFTPMSLHNENNSLDIWYQCNIELVTCSECVIRVSFIHTNFSMRCDEPEDNNRQNYMKFKKCPCEYILFSEPPYEQDISGQEYCGDGKSYRSKTRTLNLKLVYRAASSHVFSLQYFSERMYITILNRNLEK